MEEKTWRCRKCGEKLILRRTAFDYMGRSFAEDVSCCPKCGKPLISNELASGRMAEAEEMLEDK